MTSGEEGLEVFQDLLLTGPEAHRPALRQALIARATGPWRHAPEAERAMAAPASGEVMAFERDAGEGLEAAGLALWARPDGYEVTNIVPRYSRELGRSGYNALLMDFAGRVAGPAARESGFALDVTAPRRKLGDRLSAEAAQALMRFSKAANKSTGSSHPLDRRRWLAFLLQVHEDRLRIDGSELARWLVEVEGWEQFQALELASQYEFGLEVLDARDRRTP